MEKYWDKRRNDDASKREEKTSMEKKRKRGKRGNDPLNNRSHLLIDLDDRPKDSLSTIMDD